MDRMWAIVMEDGTTAALGVFGRKQAIEAACEMLARGRRVKLIRPDKYVEGDEVIALADLVRHANEIGIELKGSLFT